MKASHEELPEWPPGAAGPDAPQDIRALGGADPRQCAALAESYSALGQLLAAAAPPLDEAALVRRLAAQIARDQTRTRRLRRTAAAAALVLASAAGLLLAANLAGPAIEPAPQRVAPQLALGPQPQMPAMRAEAAPRRASPAPAAPAGELAWEDDFHAQLESAQSSLRLLEETWGQGPDALAIVRQQLDEVARELQETPL